VRSSVSWLPLIADALVLVGIGALVAMQSRDLGQGQVARLTWRQRFGARYQRHPRLFKVQVICAAVAACLWIGYWVSFLA
jgi:hypothetical protein